MSDKAASRATRPHYDTSRARHQAVARAVRQTPAATADPILIPGPYSVPLRAGTRRRLREHVILITQCEFIRRGVNGIIIDRPGRYRLAENIDYAPTQERTTAITIAASRVTLDLGPYLLTQVNTTGLTYGIGVARDVDHVRIRGATGQAQVLNFTLSGVRILGRTNFVTVEGVDVAQTVPVQLTNEDIPASCADMLTFAPNIGVCVGEGDTGSIHFAGTDRANLVQNFVFRDNVVRGAVIGLQVIFTFGFTVLRNLVTANTYYGALFGTSWVVPSLTAPDEPAFPVLGDGVVKNNRFDANRGLNVDLANPADTFQFDFLSGLAFYGARTVDVSKNTIHDNFNNGFILAVDHDGSEAITWTDCTMKNNVSELEICDGWHCSGSVANTLGNTDCLNIPYPFETNRSITVRRCVSQNNSAATSCSGFRFAFPQEATVQDSIATGNTSGQLASGFRMQGEEPGGQGLNLVFERCVSQGNVGGDFNPVAGFLVHEDVQNVIIRNCVAQGNVAAEGTAPTYAAGVVVNARNFPGSGPVIKVTIEDSTLNSNGAAGASRASGGVVVAHLVNEPVVANVLVQNNTVAYNVGDGISILGEIPGVVVKRNEADQNTGFGVAVRENPTPVLVIGNISWSNGAGEYEGVAASAIVTGSQVDPPVAVGLKNVALTPIPTL